MSVETLSIKIDPFRILGLSPDASESEIRARYLQLIKEFPPERSPDRFREIQAAYETARDPLAMANLLVEFCCPDEPPTWESVIEQQAKHPPQMSVDFLLSLGNRSPTYRPPEEPEIRERETSI